MKIIFNLIKLFHLIYSRFHKINQLTNFHFKVKRNLKYKKSINELNKKCSKVKILKVKC